MVPMAGNNSGPTRIMALERQRRVLELRKAGVTFAVIAEEVGYSSPQAAHRAFKAAMDELIQEPAMDLRTIQIERLNYALMKVWPGVQAGDLKAIDSMLRIQERLDRLMGTEAPSQVDVHHEGAVLVIQGNEDDYVAQMEQMARTAGAIDVPSEELPVRTDPTHNGDIPALPAPSLFDAADYDQDVAEANEILEAVVIEPPCERYVRPADPQRAEEGLCARCEHDKDAHG